MAIMLMWVLWKYLTGIKKRKRVRKQLEVDFVVNQSSQRYYIQVAYDMTSEEKQTQEFNSLRNIPDSFKKRCHCKWK